MGEVKMLVNSDIAWLIDRLNKDYYDGKIQSLVYAVEYKNEQFATGHTGKYLKKLGLAHSIINDIQLEANEK